MCKVCVCVCQPKIFLQVCDLQLRRDSVACKWKHCGISDGYHGKPFVNVLCNSGMAPVSAVAHPNHSKRTREAQACGGSSVLEIQAYMPSYLPNSLFQGQGVP